MAGNRGTVFRLTTDQADKTSFPEGCPVLYNFRRRSFDPAAPVDSASDVDGGASTLDAREGVVRHVSLNTDSKRFEFTIERRGRDGGGSTAEGGRPSSSSSDEAGEDDVAYAVRCPVIVTRPDGGGSEGEVLFAKPAKDENGETTMSYIVQYYSSAGENSLRMEEGVTADRVSFDRNRNAKREGEDDGRRADEDSSVSSGPSAAPPPVLVPVCASNDSEGGSRKAAAARGDDGRRSENRNARFDEERWSPREFAARGEQTESPPGNAPPQSDVYVRKSAGRAPPHGFDAATTSPLTNDSSCDGGDRPAVRQHRMINFQPPDPSRKRGASGRGIASPNKSRKFERPDLAAKTTSPDASGESPKNRQAPHDDRREERRELPAEPKEPEMSEQTEGRESGAEVTTCQLTVPLWVLNYKGNLFKHLVGQESGGKCGYKTKRIFGETNCRVQISRCNIQRGQPMKITISSCHQYNVAEIRADMESAISTVEGSLLDFVGERGERGATGRLRFELRTGSLPTPLLPRAEGGAVRVDGDLWMQLLELPCLPRRSVVDSGDGVRLDRVLQDRIRDRARCSAEVYADRPDAPLVICRPYVLVHGRESRLVDTAAAMLTSARHG